MVENQGWRGVSSKLSKNSSARLMLFRKNIGGYTTEYLLQFDAPQTASISQKNWK
jgi:hypothetical protein